MDSAANDMQSSLNAQIARFTINTGYIFSDLQEHWRAFDRAFLVGQVQNALLNTLCRHQIFSLLPEEAEERKKEIFKAEERYQLLSGRIQGDAFPFIDYFFANNGGQEQIVDYNAPCQLSQDDRDFMLFYALKLSLVDILEVEAFLEFHLINSFQNDIDQYKEFLKAVELKYREHILEKCRIRLMEYITALTRQVESPAENEQKGVPEYTLARQVLIMHYIFQNLDITRSSASLTDMAKLIQGLTGRQTNASDIRNTEIYKRISHPFSLGDKALSEDLRFVRNIFDKLNHIAITEQINKEILARE